MVEQALFQAIKKRVSVRTYRPRDWEPGAIQALESQLPPEGQGPYGTVPELRLILNEAASGKGQKLGTYGTIRGADLFLAGAALKDREAVTDLGYLMEEAVLAFTAAGYGTCWLGGTFNRKGFLSRLALSEGKTVHAVTPIGVPAQKRAPADRAMRVFSRGDRRKGWGSLFFRGEEMRPLDPEETGPWREAFSAVRAGPSAMNKQPWRIVQGAAGFDFYRDKRARLPLPDSGYTLQDLDMGIALSHWAIAARAAGLPGHWGSRPPRQEPAGYLYYLSWLTAPEDAVRG